MLIKVYHTLLAKVRRLGVTGCGAPRFRDDASDGPVEIKGLPDDLPDILTVRAGEVVEVLRIRTRQDALHGFHRVPVQQEQPR